MKIALLGDTHFGVKSFSTSFLQNQLSFFDEQFFPFLENNNIDTIVQFGDIFDNRRTIDINFLNLIIDNFFAKIAEKNLKLYIFLGNHDIYFKNTRNVSLIKVVTELFPNNIILIEEKEIVQFGKHKFLMVPWLVPGEKIQEKDMKKADVVFGHFEIKDFEISKGHLAKEGLDKIFFKNYGIKAVYSGHFHLKNTDNYITYLGTPYQINFGDYNTEKGFYVLDTDTLQYEFFENVVSTRYIKIIYDDSTEPLMVLKGLGDYLFFNDIKEIPLSVLQNVELKFIVNSAKEKPFDEVLYYLKENSVKYTLVDNTGLQEAISEDVDRIDKTPEQLFMEQVKILNPALIEKAQELLSEAQNATK